MKVTIFFLLLNTQIWDNSSWMGTDAAEGVETVRKPHSFKVWYATQVSYFVSYGMSNFEYAFTL